MQRSINNIKCECTQSENVWVEGGGYGQEKYSVGLEKECWYVKKNFQIMKKRNSQGKYENITKTVRKSIGTGNRSKLKSERLYASYWIAKNPQMGEKGFSPEQENKLESEKVKKNYWS